MVSEQALQPSPTDDALNNLERTPREIVQKLVHELNARPRPWPTRVLRNNNITDSAELGELLEAAPPWCREAYFKALGGRPAKHKRMTFRMLEGYYPDWPALFLDALEKQSLAGEQAKVTVACQALRDLDIPIKEGWIYARMSPASKLYDQEFALEVSGATSAAMAKIQEKLETDLAELDDPRLSPTRLAYLKAHPYSPVGKSPTQLEVKTKHHAIQEHRLTVSAELVEESKGLMDRIRGEVKDVTSIASPEERRGGADDRGRPGAGAATPEAETEGEGEEEGTGQEG